MNDTTTLPLRNPRTGQSDGQLPIVPADAVAALGQALRAAQPAWAALDIEARCQRLSALADALVARRDAMVELLLAVVAIQCLSSVRPVKASAVWLAGNGPIHMSSPSEANDCALET